MHVQLCTWLSLTLSSLRERPCCCIHSSLRIAFMQVEVHIVIESREPNLMHSTQEALQ